MEFVWYEKISNTGDIQQGDIIYNCPVVIPPAEIIANNEYEVEVQEVNVIILSQSCDLQENKIEIVLVCPFYTLSQFKSLINKPTNKTLDMINEIKKGRHPGYHLLNKNSNDKLPKEHIIVDFRNVYGIHFSALKSVIKKQDIRFRLMPPYREHLSQAFARFFMRVGLPQDVDLSNVAFE